MHGVAMIEYAILLALIAIAVVVAVPDLSKGVVNVFAHASSIMDVRR